MGEWVTPREIDPILR